MSSDIAFKAWQNRHLGDAVEVFEGAFVRILAIVFGPLGAGMVEEFRVHSIHDGSRLKEKQKSEKKKWSFARWRHLHEKKRIGPES